ncbi:MAG TPA: SGNH/GDSL hydrolase family protein [Candidatus Margulisiibacteriota bacterium]|nr:SGNH/GDSL hydrolase family protein [Candidatus Margulisiibacteriota bacterium]
MAKNITLFVIFSLLSLIGGEFIVRKIAPQQLVDFNFEPDMELAGVNRPNCNFISYYGCSVRTNSAGFRMDEEIDRSRGQILCIGDSFTFGWGQEIENSFYGILSRTMQGKFKGIQLVNAGVGGYGINQVYKLLVRLHERHTMDTAGIIYFMSANDPYDALYGQTVTYRRDAGKIVVQDKMAFSPFFGFLLMRTPYGWLNQHSHLFILMKKGFRGLVRHGNENNNYMRVDQLSVSSSQVTDTYEASIVLLERLSAYCSGNDLPLLIVWVPSFAELDPGINKGMWQALSNFKGMVQADRKIMDTADFYDPTEQMRIILDERHLSVKDIYVSDGHFSKEGNAIFAGACTGRAETFYEQRIRKNR